MTNEQKKDEPIESGLDQITKQSEEYLNGWRRAKADLINFQRQTEREREGWIQFANATCLQAFFPILESLDQATSDECIGKSIDDHILGVKKIKDQFMGVLEKMGIEPIKCVGEPANPEVHEVVGKEKNNEHAPGLIVKEAQKGFLLHGKVLRPAKVIVSE